MIHLDTHVVVWLYAGTTHLLSSRAREVLERELEGEGVVVSPIVLLELEHLREIGKTSQSAAQVLGELQGELGLHVSRAPFASVVSHAARHSWTRDPFDRIIVGQAEADEALLLTRDESIRARFEGAVW